MTVSEIMTADVITVPPAMPIGDARTLMRKENIHHLVVKRGAHPVGVVSARDLSRIGASAKSQTVADVMTRHLMTIDGQASLGRASYIMRGRSIGCLIVLKRGSVAGIVTTSDLIDLLGTPSRRKGRADARTAIHHRVAHRHRSRADGLW